MVEPASATQLEAPAEERASGAPLVSVIVPAYNEEASIALEVERVEGALRASPFAEFEVLVIDDGSTDDTASRARAAGATVISHLVNQGQGAALKTGIARARGAYVVFIDGDGTYPTQEIPRLLSQLVEGGYEQVIGDRQSEQGEWRLLRVPVKLLLRRFASFLSGQAVGDLNSGLRALTREAAQRYAPLIPQGFSNSTTLTLATLSHRRRLAFVPIDYHERKVGKSKFRPVADTYNMLLTIIRMVMYVDPLRVLLPVALLFVLGGSIKAITDIVRFDLHITTSSVLIILTGVQIGAIALLADLLVRRTQ